MTLFSDPFIESHLIMPLTVYRTSKGLFVENDAKGGLIEAVSLDSVLRQPDPEEFLKALLVAGRSSPLPTAEEIMAPIENQEVWASGVTYYRSRNARMEESKDAGGGNFYDRVYTAERPELFFKGTAHRVVGPQKPVRIRGDAAWTVPEPELTLVINAHGQIVGYTIGNDMSSRDIEGENPLYLPQAKVYDGSCALGPSILMTDRPPHPDTKIEMQIRRSGTVTFSGSTTLSEIKRDFKTLVEYLYREMTFPNGCFLMTGTGIVPPDSFTLQSKDEVCITIEPIGTLVNHVA